MTDIEPTAPARTRSTFTFALGAAFLLQFVTSLAAGLMSGGGPLAKDQGIRETLVDFASHAATYRWSVLLDLVTAMGVIWLAVMVYAVVKATNRTAAGVALTFWVVEAVLLTVSRCASSVVIGISQAYAATDDAALEPLAQSWLHLQDAASGASMVFFGVGAVLFYGLLIGSHALPTWLPGWGLVAVIPVLADAVVGAFAMSIPFIAIVPYVPVELVAGGYILTRGLRRIRAAVPVAAA